MHVVSVSQSVSGVCVGEDLPNLSERCELSLNWTVNDAVYQHPERDYHAYS